MFIIDQGLFKLLLYINSDLKLNKKAKANFKMVNRYCRMRKAIISITTPSHRMLKAENHKRVWDECVLISNRLSQGNEFTETLARRDKSLEVFRPSSFSKAAEVDLHLSFVDKIRTS